MNKTEYCIVMTTTDRDDIASAIAENLINLKLVACAQVDEVRSFFFYNQKMSKEKEYRLMAKALSANYDDVEKSIKETHNYDLPEIIRIDISGGEVNYLNWIKNCHD